MTEKKQTNSHKIQELIQSYTGEPVSVIAVPSELIHFLGDTKKGLVLAQIIYSSDKGKRPDGLIFKTYKEMFEITGVKEGTLRTYFNEFKEKGFFDWQIKKANAFPTVHFRFNMSKFLPLFLAFLGNRYRKNQGNETSEIKESLTKTTNIDLTHIGKNYQTEVKVKGKESDTEAFYIDFDNIPAEALLSLEPVEEVFYLRQKFKPSLENLYWAVSNYPNKSPKLATENFIKYYRDEEGKKVKKTVSGWQNQWRKSIESQFESRGYDESKLFEEQSNIKNQVCQIVLNVARNVCSVLLHKKQFYSILCKEEFKFSQEAIDECIAFLVSEGYLARFFNDYLYVVKIKEKGEFRDVTDNVALYYEWNNKDETLERFINEKGLASYAEICGKYSPASKESVDIYLEGGVASQNLVKCANYYFLRSSYEENESYQFAVDSKLAELRIENPVQFNESDCISDDELQELFTDLYGDNALDVQGLLATV